MNSFNTTLMEDGGHEADGLFVSTPYGYCVAGVSMVAFKLTHFAFGLAFQPPSSCKSELDRWKWMNIAISWIHSTIIGLACIFGLYAYPELMSDLAGYNNAYLFTVASVSTGYFVYDFLDIVLCGHSRPMWEVLLHHVAVLNSFIYNLTQCRFIGYTIVALFVEVNSILLHTRKLIQMDGRVGLQSVPYRLIVWSNLVSFVACRFAFSLAVITYGIITTPSMMSTYYLYSLSLTMVLTWIVNLMLFWRLVKSDLLRHRRLHHDGSRRQKDGPIENSSGSTTKMRVENGHNNNYDKIADSEDYRLKKSS